MHDYDIKHLFNPNYNSNQNFWLSFNDVLNNVSTLSIALNNKEDDLFIKKIIDNTKFRLDELQKLYKKNSGVPQKQVLAPYNGVSKTSMDGFRKEDLFLGEPDDTNNRQR